MCYRPRQERLDLLEQRRRRRNPFCGRRGVRLLGLGRDEEHRVGPRVAGSLPHLQLLRLGGALRGARHDNELTIHLIVNFFFSFPMFDTSTLFDSLRVVNPMFLFAPLSQYNVR